MKKQTKGLTRDTIDKYYTKEIVVEQCKHCKEMSRPNVSMFGDFEFYGKPYEHQRKRLDNWVSNIKKIIKN